MSTWNNIQKWKKWFSLTFARSAKPLIIVRFWAPFFDQNRTNAIFHFWEPKSGNELIFRFWGAFGATNAPERKSWPKTGKSDFGRFGLQKRAQNLMFFTVWRSERKLWFFVIRTFLRFFAFWAQKQFLASKSCQNRPKRWNSALLRLFAKMASKMPKKALSRATFLAHARF